MLDTEKVTQELFDFIDASPTAFHAAAQAAKRLEAAGYRKVGKETGIRPEAGGRYYMTRNGSSLIAFRIPKGELRRFRIAAAHSDSPAFKVKETPEMGVEGHYIRLNTEGYGGMIQSTWLDRPLSVAGRVIVETENGPRTRLVNLDRDLCVIPNVAIHFNREINKGYAYNPQVDLLPLNPFSRPGDPLQEINGVVIHYVGNPGTSAQANRNYFANLSLTAETYASSHFVVGLAGEVVQCVPLSEISYCSNSRNDDTIAIEVCHPDESGQFSPETLESVERLTAWLCAQFDLDTSQVIRHYDVSGKICPRYYVEHEDAWQDLLAGVQQAIPAFTEEKTA